MTAFRVMITLCMAALAVANPAEQLRAVRKPKTPNQMMDKIAEDTVSTMIASNWIPTKNVQNDELVIPISQVGSDSTSPEDLTLTGATLTGLGSFKRSKSGSFNSAESVLSGTYKLNDLEITATDAITFPQTGQAPSQNINGQVTELVKSIFCDVEINVDRLEETITTTVNGEEVEKLVVTKYPKSIKSYDCEVKSDKLEKATNIGDNNIMAPMHESGLRSALKLTVLNIVKTNVKVAFNKSIQGWKNTVIA